LVNTSPRINVFYISTYLFKQYEYVHDLRISKAAINVGRAFGGGFIVYFTLKKIVGLRVSQEEEYYGADLSIHRIASTTKN